jgi:hypothetical protein
MPWKHVALLGYQGNTLHIGMPWKHVALLGCQGNMLHYWDARETRCIIGMPMKHVALLGCHGKNAVLSGVSGKVIELLSVPEKMLHYLGR